MSEDRSRIVCKATQWFLLRAAAILLMFSIFAVLFYKDGTTGYRQKNLIYHVHKAFGQATKDFSSMNAEGNLTAEDWKKFTKSQTVKLPKNTALLPRDTKIPMPWPEILSDFNKVKKLQNQLLWNDYTEEKKWSSKPPKKAYSQKKIKEQIYGLYVCATLSAVTLFFLIRTSRRSLIADEKNFYAANGTKISYSSMQTLDLRKWETKGIASLSYQQNGTTRKTRIDGLTYGGFKKEKGALAEKLMEKIKANFSGELIEYLSLEEESGQNDASEAKNAEKVAD